MAKNDKDQDKPQDPKVPESKGPVKDRPVNPYELPPLPPTKGKKAFWLGTLPTCPQFNCAIGGVMFHRYTNPPVGTDAASMETQRSYGKGSVEMLSEDHARAILESLKTFVVRFHGRSGRGSIMKVTNKLFNREAEDQPLAMHVYLVPLTQETSVMRTQARGGYPPSVYKVAGGEEEPVVPKWAGYDLHPGIEDLDRVPAGR